tara:strand:+ start:1342 stop:1857 length:516 start_codon:yes stop_codon:yes gene_type:complete
VKHHTSKKVTLARYGGIGKVVKQKGNYSSNEDDMTFHQAPERYGYYAFIFPYIELFLLGSPVNKAGKEDEQPGRSRGRFVEKKAKIYKKFFATDGTLWTHMEPKKRHMVIAERGGWYKVNVSDLHRILENHISESQKAGAKMGFSPHQNPYSYFSKDDMEVFITRDTKINS